MNQRTIPGELNDAAVVEGAMKAIKHLEAQLDDNLRTLDAIMHDDEELKAIRIARLKEIKNKAAEEELWRVQGHGKLEEIADEKQWFECTRLNKRVVCHFYRPTTEICTLLDSHLEKIARVHMETKFIKINVEKCPYLCDRLNVYVIPSLIMTKDNFVHDTMEGFDDLGGSLDFTTIQLERRLARKGIVDLAPVMKGRPGEENPAETLAEKVESESDEDW